MPKTPVKIFISYAHKDAPFFDVFRDGLKNHLASSDMCDFSSWTDADIPVGSNWDEEIQNKLGGADVAVLCVSANFLNSRYIRSDEFENLVKKYPHTIIIPVYFNHCNINAWEDLAVKQFFKPAGDRYGEAGQPDFAFCDLVAFNKNNGLFIPNPNVDLYLQDFVKKIEPVVTGKTGSTYSSSNSPADNLPPVLEDGQNKRKAEGKKWSDKIVEAVIITAIVLSLGFIIYTLAFNGAAEGKQFNSTIGAAMFFGSGGLFIFNRRYEHR